VIARLLAAMLLAGSSGSVLAQDFRSVAEAAILYDAPSAQAARRFVIARLTPVEVVLTVEGWAKVRDADGDLAWIERRALSDKRTVMIVAGRAEARARPDAEAPVVFAAERHVVLDLVEKAGAGWVRIRHRDGATGFVRVTDLWGL
jgi:SH3-like domain-containing protein